MKKVLLFICIIIPFLCSCTSQWEYKIVSVKGEEIKDSSARNFNISDSDLNLFGDERWELVGIYTNNETVFPNFGNAEYVTGIRENVRTESVNFVFKRKK